MSPLAPVVTVIIPSLNRPQLTRRALASALAQDGVRVEVVIVDDGSTPPIAQSLGQLDQRVRIVRHETSKGVAAARNHGMAIARAPWLAFLDDDDVWAPGKLALQLAAITEVDAKWCVSGAISFDESMQKALEGNRPASDTALALELCRCNAVPGGGSGVVVSAEAVRLAGGFDETLSMLADWEMWHRLAHRWPAAIRSEYLVGYLQHAGSMTARFGDHSAEMQRMERVVIDYCDASSEERQTVYLDWLADRLLPYRRFRASILKAKVAMRRRSPRHFLTALRFAFVPSTVSILDFVRRTSVAAPDMPPWLRAMAPGSAQFTQGSSPPPGRSDS